MWGFPPTCLLQSSFANRCSSVCSSVVALFVFFCLPPLLPLLTLQAVATDWPGATVSAGWRRRGGWGETLQIGPNRQQDGAVQACLRLCAIMLWAMYCGCGGHEL